MFLNFDTVEAFAVRRNPSLSFPFLKENGELLSIAVSTGLLIEPRALALYDDIYTKAYRLVECYPQYYRFILGMVLDLEHCGVKGHQGQRIASYIEAQNFIEYDTSDVRRLEALYLLSIGHGSLDKYDDIYNGLMTRIDGFIKSPELYSKFNKPFFYDLTHIIYFLTNYGRQELPLKHDPVPCLMNIGLLALLDNDADLLSEVGLCLKYLNVKIPPYWDSYLLKSKAQISISYDGTIASSLNSSVDEYHLYLVSNAYMAAQHQCAFQDNFENQTPSFYVKEQSESILSKLSNWAHPLHMKPCSYIGQLDLFIETCSADELQHWNSSLNSHPSGSEVMKCFSGLM